MNGASPVNLTLSPSPGFAVAILAVHAAAAVCLWLLPLPGPLATVLATLVVALGAAVSWDRALLAARGSVIGIELSGPAAAVLRLRDGRRVPSAVGPVRFVSRFCVSLPVRAPLRRSLVVTTSMLKPESFRILCLWALWDRVPDPSRVVSRQLPA
ncbi:MAG: hypothetical protein ACT4P9_13255 [Betaproteobacteria bacterium]